MSVMKTAASIQAKIGQPFLDRGRMLAAERDGVIGMIRDAIVRYKLTRNELIDPNRQRSKPSFRRGF